MSQGKIQPFLLMPNTLALSLGGVQGRVEGQRVTTPGNYLGTSRWVRASICTSCQGANHSHHRMTAPTTFLDGELKSGYALQSNRGADWMLMGVFICCEHNGVSLHTPIITRS